MEKKPQWESLRELSHDPYLASKYELLGVIGEGCFGKVLKAKARRSSRLCALKLEHYRKGRTRTVLRNQIEVLKKLQGQIGIPALYGYGQWGNGLYCQMELLEHDMNTLRKYSTVEITELTLELLKIMEGIHAAGIVHQDLKPHNIMQKDGKLYIIDFGLARQLTSLDKSKNPYAIKGFIGTPRYASVRAHNMFEQGKKDDLESLFYNIAYLYYQRLPWSKLHVATETKLEKIKLLKIRHHDTLFQQMPVSFQQAFQYITALPPLADPDYAYITGFFKRTRTVVLPIGQNQQQRSTIKRSSLNMTNFLQVPDAIYELRMENSNQSKEGSRSSRSIGMASDAILSEYLEFEEDDKENYCEGENIQPTLPDISKFFSNIVLRNPFGS